MAKRKHRDPSTLTEAEIADVVSSLELTEDYTLVSKETNLSYEALEDLRQRNRKKLSEMAANNNNLINYAAALGRNLAINEIIKSNYDSYINSKEAILSKVQMAKTMAINAIVERLSDTTKLKTVDLVFILEKLTNIEEKTNKVDQNNANANEVNRFIPLSMRTFTDVTIIDTPFKEVKTKNQSLTKNKKK